MNAVTAIAAALILAGAALFLLAGIGLLRFPNLFARMHAATKPATLGMILVVSGTALEVGGTANVTRLLLVIALQLVTAPIAAHMIGRASHQGGVDVGGEIDELAEDDRRLEQAGG